MTKGKYDSWFSLKSKALGTRGEQEFDTDGAKVGLTTSKPKDSSFDRIVEHFSSYHLIQAEVKTSCATDEKKDPIHDHNVIPKKGFNFQHIHLECFDIGVFQGVWWNDMTRWVMTRDEVVEAMAKKRLSKQGRGSSEGQFTITPKKWGVYEQYITCDEDLAKNVLAAYKRLKNPIPSRLPFFLDSEEETI